MSQSGLGLENRKIYMTICEKWTKKAYLQSGWNDIMTWFSILFPNEKIIKRKIRAQLITGEWKSFALLPPTPNWFRCFTLQMSQILKWEFFFGWGVASGEGEGGNGDGGNLSRCWNCKAIHLAPVCVCERQLVVALFRYWYWCPWPMVFNRAPELVFRVARWHISPPRARRTEWKGVAWLSHSHRTHVTLTLYTCQSTRPRTTAAAAAVPSLWHAQAGRLCVIWLGNLDSHPNLTRAVPSAWLGAGPIGVSRPVASKNLARLRSLSVFAGQPSWSYDWPGRREPPPPPPSCCNDHEWLVPTIELTLGTRYRVGNYLLRIAQLCIA